MNDMKLELLRKVFWDMNSISYRVERHTKGSGKDKTTVVYLYITISHKTTDEMADQYHFNADQKKQLAELLDEKYRSLWSSVLYGIGTGDGEIVTIALSQLGNSGWSALLELVRLHITCGVVRLLRQLVRERMRLY